MNEVQAVTAQYFEEDAVVFRSGRVTKIGTVIESYIDLYSEDEFSDSGDELVRPGKVRVAFYPNGQESVVDESKLELIERSLMPGDIVRSTVSREGYYPKGFVTDCTVECFLQVKGTNQVISRVDSRLLKDCYPYGNEPIYIELDGWIGKTFSREFYDVTLEFSDGARCIVEHEELAEFDDSFDVALKKKDGSEYTFSDHYVGQKLRGSMSSLQPSKIRWIKSTRLFGPKMSKTQKKKTITVVVIDIDVTKIEAQWLYCGISSDELLKPQPPREIFKDRLHKVRLIDPYVHATAQIGDTFYYTIQSNDKIEVVSPSGRTSVSQYLLDRVLTPAPSEHQSDNQTAQGSYHDKVQDDSDDMKEYNPSDEADTVDEYTAAAAADMETNGGRGSSDEEWVDVDSSTTTATSNPVSNSNRAIKSRKGRKKKRPSTASNTTKPKDNGLSTISITPGLQVPVEIVLSETYVDIMWQDGSEEKRIPSRQLYSVYHLDDNEFFPGDYVVRNDADVTITPDEYGVICSVDEQQRLANVRWFYAPDSKAIPMCVIQSNEISVYEIKDHPTYKYRPGAAVLRTHFDDNEEMQCCDDDVVGTVVRLHTDGLMSVKWADDCVSQCYPEQLLLVANMHESDSEDDEFGDSSVDDDEMEDDLSDFDESDMEEDGNHSRSGSVGDPAEEGDGDCVEKMLSDFGEMMKELLDSYNRVLGSINDMQLSKTTMSWSDFNKFIDPFQKLTDLHRKMRMLDDSLREEMRRIDFKGFQRALKKAKIYSDMASQLYDIKSHLQDDNNSLPPAAVGRFLAAVAVNMDKLPSATTCSESAYFGSLALLGTKIKQLAEAGDADESLTDDSLLEATDNVKLSRQDRDQLKTEIIHLLEQTDKQAKLEAQLETVDYIVDFFSALKDISQTVLEAYQSGTTELNIKPEAVCDTKLTTFKDEFAACKQETCDVKEEITAEDSHFCALDDVKPEVETLLKVKVKDEAVEYELNELNMHLKDDVTSASLALEPFVMIDTCPSCHKYSSKPQPICSSKYVRTVKSHLDILSRNLPDGIIVRAYSDRMDCLSAMIIGPAITPYENALFIFDIHLPADYPSRPPHIYYHSYCNDRLNPNLYTDGKVCVSLLGTWSGKEQELWNSQSSNLLQVLVSIQGLILVKEPYYNEAGYEKQRGTVEGSENSKKYNEMVHLKTLQSMIAMLQRPHDTFQSEVMQHWRVNSAKFINNLEKLVSYPSCADPSADSSADPSAATASHDFKLGSSTLSLDYPLLPLSKGCHLSLAKLITKFKEELDKVVCKS